MTREPQDGERKRRQWPESIEAAVAMMHVHVPPDEQARIAAMPLVALIDLHFDLGAWVRCTFGLSTGNDALLEATGCSQPNDACDVLIEAFWSSLRDAAESAPGAARR